MTTPAVFPRITLSVVEAAAALGCERTTLYRLAKQGPDPLPLRRMGGKSFVLITELEDWIKSRPLGAMEGKGSAGVAERQRNRKARAAEVRP